MQCARVLPGADLPGQAALPRTPCLTGTRPPDWLWRDRLSQASPSACCTHANRRLHPLDPCTPPEQDRHGKTPGRAPALHKPFDPTCSPLLLALPTNPRCCVNHLSLITLKAYHSFQHMVGKASPKVSDDDAHAVL